ncbi:hypothetical protein Acr_07g0011780 [Actinidia rufa]|uniref:Basic helix-loop-helix (BHLH) DNA-binding superfamily protein n=1 Tax=Actinidia rufa TaxID=165716 RepID=A0A7J0EX51_9ERIC|nr:hypothetical protein Acr_07g0011780 [Actinidia rufa]
MAEESSIATSSATPNWWPDLHANSLSSWSSNSNPWHPQNPNSNSSGEEDLSISNQSGLSVDSSRHLIESAPANDFIGETASDNQLWSHVLLSAASRGELNNSIEIGDNSINMLSSKSLSIGMFEPACDYLKKMDTSWEFTNQPSLNNFEKHFNGFNESLIESERLTKLSNLVNNWSIAPPDSGINHPFDSQSCNISLSSTMDRFSPSDLRHMKQRMSNSDLYSGYGHEMKVKDEYQIGLNNSLVGNNKYYYGVAETDTASVLGETIGYIKYLQEQVQDPWGGLDRKDRGGDIMFDLKSRGLCLVPISCTPQAYRDNSGSDYWSTPTYRGCLYR